LYVALSRATAKSNIKILALPPNAEEYNEEDKRKDKKNSKKKDKKKPSVKEKIKTSDSKNKKTVTRNGTYTKNIVYKEVLTL
jgi:ATP-dependent DNA helicase PIF1